MMSMCFQSLILKEKKKLNINFRNNIKFQSLSIDKKITIMAYFSIIGSVTWTLLITLISIFAYYV